MAVEIFFDEDYSKASQIIYTLFPFPIFPQKLLMQRLMYSFFGVCSLLTYVKYYIADFDTAVFHLGFIASGFTVAVYGSPLASVVRTNILFHMNLYHITHNPYRVFFQICGNS